MGYYTTQKPLCSLSILLNGMRFILYWVLFWFYDLSRFSPSPHPFRHHHDSYCMPHDWRRSWRPYHARTPCGQLQRQRETAKRLFRHMTPPQLCILSVNNSLIRYETCNTTMTNNDFSDILFCFVSFLVDLSRIPFLIYKNLGFLQTRQLHWGQHSSFFLQSQLSITDITESIRDITEW